MSAMLRRNPLCSKFNEVVNGLVRLATAERSSYPEEGPAASIKIMDTCRSVWRDRGKTPGTQVLRPTSLDCHIEGMQDKSCFEGASPRPVCVTGLSAVAEGIGHDGQIRESLWPSARRSMSATQNLSHVLAWKLDSTKSGAHHRRGPPTMGNLACG